jgi:hypothetical protein
MMDKNDLTHDQEKRIFAALKFFGMPPHYFHWADITESGQVFVGLTEILPKGGLFPVKPAHLTEGHKW